MERLVCLTAKSGISAGTEWGTVFDFCSQIGAASDEIPVVVRVGLQEIGHFRSLYQIPAVAMPGILEAKVTFVTVKCTQIIIQVKTKDYNTTI